MPTSGYKQTLYYGGENVYGSADAIDTSIGLVQSVNPTETNNLIKIRTLGGTRDYANIVPGKFEVSGSFEYMIQDGAFLRMAIGEDTATTTTVDSGPKFHTGADSYLHIMGSAASPQTDAFPSFTLEFTDEEDAGGAGTQNLKRVYNGCRVNTLSISGTVDEPVRVSCDWIAQGVTISTAAATSVTENTDDPFVFYQGWVYATTGTIGAYDTLDEDTSAIAEVNSFDFSVNNNLEATWYISGTTAPTQTLRGLKSLIVKGRDYEGNLGLHFNNKTMYERFLGASGATESQGTLNDYTVVLDFVRSGAIGSNPKLDTDNWLRIVMYPTKFDTMNIPGAPEDIVAENIGLAIEGAKIYVVDDISSYA